MEDEIKQNQDSNSNNSIQMSDFPNLSNIDDSEDVPNNTIILEIPRIPIQIADDCDLAQNFVRLEKLANERVKIKDQIETKIKSKDDIEQEILALENEVKENDQRIKEAWKLINTRDEQISEEFEELEEEINKDTSLLMKLKECKRYPIEQAFIQEGEKLSLTLRTGTGSTTSWEYGIETVEPERRRMLPERKEITKDEAKSVIKKLEMKAKTYLEDSAKLECFLKKERKENKIQKADMKNLEQQLRNDMTKCSQMKMRRKNQQKQIKREQLLLKEIEEEMEKEKNAILRAHNVC